MTSLDRNSPVPLYYQLKQVLLEQIRSQHWATGEVIPSEQELGELYGLSRTTIRQTLADLVAEGYLIRQRGRGTFIARPKITYSPSSKLELNELMRQQGVDLGWRLLGCAWEAPDPQVAAALCLKPSAKESKESKNPLRVYVIRRLRLAGTEPIGYHFAYLLPDFSAAIDESAFTSGESLDYLAPAQQRGLYQSLRIERTLEARLAGEIENDLLSLPAGSPVLYLERLVSDQDGNPIEFLRAAFRGDRFKYRITA